MTNLNLLNEFKDMAPLKKSNIFESLKGSSNLYSMRIKMQANIRILYSIDSNGTILLYGFTSEVESRKQITKMRYQ